jgi:DNA repair photolyase
MNKKSKLPNPPSKEGKKNAKPVSGTKEWAPININFINGCAHDCKYCYSKAMAIRYKRKTRDTWKQEEVRFDKLFPTVKPKNGYTMFPSSHEISPENHKYALTVLDVLLNKGHRVMIVIKPHLEVVKAICQKFDDYKDRILFRFTIGSVDSETLRFWEPNAPSFEERLASLKHAFSMGFMTSVSCEPALDTNTIELAKTVMPYVTDAVWLGKVNRLKGIIKLNCGDDVITQKAAEQLEKSQTDEWAWGLYKHFKDNPQIKWKDSMKKVLGLHRPSEKGLDI